MVLGCMKTFQSQNPTSIGWVDYLDTWAKSKIFQNFNLDFFDSPSNQKTELSVQGVL